MAKVLAVLTLFLALQQDTPPKVTAMPGEPSEKEWPVVGTAELPNESLVQVSARRDDRRYEENTGKFYEIPSDTARKYGTGIVSPRKDFVARLPAVPAAAGMYQLIVTLKSDDMVLYESRICLGRVDRLFTVSRDRLRKLIETIEKAEGFLKEIISFHAKEKIPSPKLRDEYLARIIKWENGLEEMLDDIDYTATIDELRSVYYHLRNAQVWSAAGPGGAKGEQDGMYEEKGVFLDNDTTLGTLDKRLKKMRGILSKEIKLSIASIFDDLFERAKADSKKLARIRDYAKEAAKVAGEAPEKDEAFGKVMESVQAAKDEAQVTAVRAEFQKLFAELLRK